MNNQQSHPILYSEPMVRARRAGIKTMTRRVAKIGPSMDGKMFSVYPPESLVELEDGEFQRGICHYSSTNALSGPYRVPYQPGDLLWTKETFFAWGRWETRHSAKKGRDEWHFVDMTLECGHAYMYAADGDQPDKLGGKRSGGVTPQWWRRPAIFMPRVASRGLDEIVSVRVERLQNISELDALAEGIDQDTCAPVAVYRELWESINGFASWDLNPWVWVVNFRVLK